MFTQIKEAQAQNKELQTQNEESLFEAHRNLIKKAIWKNRTLLAALRLEYEDVSQQLSITMLAAIRRFDPSRSESLATHIRYSLQYEILNIKRRYKPHGITGVPKDCRLEFLYIDGILPDGSIFELPADDDVTSIEFSELFDSLSKTEANVVQLRIQGYPLRRKAHIAAMDGVRQRYTALYM